VAAVAEVADQLRRDIVGDEVTFVRNRNINYTNVCTFRCKFCAFSKGPLSLNLRGNPYLLEVEEMQRRVVEAVECGATEVCLQGGIHPDFDGDYYVDVARAVKEVAPEIHVHGFTALEGLGRAGSACRCVISSPAKDGPLNPTRHAAEISTTSACVIFNKAATDEG
jgi:FO synthase